MLGVACYHYEELAAVAKQKWLKTKEQVLQEMQYIRVFKQNILLRSKTGLPLILWHHTDFINRMPGIVNLGYWKTGIFEDLGIELEVYDEDILQHVTNYF